MICAISFGDQSSIINKLRKLYQRSNLDIISGNLRMCPTVHDRSTDFLELMELNATLHRYLLSYFIDHICYNLKIDIVKGTPLYTLLVL